MTPSITPSLRHWITVIGCLFLCDVNAQPNASYTPTKTYSSESKELISELRSIMEAEYEHMLKITPPKDRELLRQVFYQRTKYLVNRIKYGSFINNDSLETYVSRILKRLAGAHTLSPHPKKVLITRDYAANAMCYGRGIYIVTVGLLGRISDEAELAFTLAHEIAHDELEHVQSNLLRQAKIDLEKKSKEQIKKILSGEIELSDVQEFRQLIYGISHYSREKELQADSLGFVIFNNARYDEQMALSMLDVLQSSREPKYDFGAEIFMPLDDEAFPLQGYFFKDQLSIYSRKDGPNIFMLSMDSVQSHPDMNIRKKMLQTYFSGSSYSDKSLPVTFVQNVTRLAEFETVESAYRSGDFDWCLFHALHLLKRFPGNGYLVSRIGKVFTKLYEVKTENDTPLSAHVSRYTAYYSPMAKLVNNMLYNLTAKETGEIAFYFLSNAGHFDFNDESHYYLLWRISELTYRYEVRDQIKDAYSEKFGKKISEFKYP